VLQVELRQPVVIPTLTAHHVPPLAPVPRAATERLELLPVPGALLPRVSAQLSTLEETVRPELGALAEVPELRTVKVAVNMAALAVEVRVGPEGQEELEEPVAELQACTALAATPRHRLAALGTPGTRQQLVTAPSGGHMGLVVAQMRLGVPRATMVLAVLAAMVAQVEQVVRRQALAAVPEVRVAAQVSVNKVLSS